MGNIIADSAFTNLNNVVKNIHEKIYRGANDRNRYQLTHSIYVWFEAGRITKIFDCLNHRKLDFSKEKPVEKNLDGFGNIGFYVNARPLVITAIKQTAPPRAVEVYTLMNDLERFIRSETANLFESI